MVNELFSTAGMSFRDLMAVHNRGSFYVQKSEVPDVMTGTAPSADKSEGSSKNVTSSVQCSDDAGGEDVAFEESMDGGFDDSVTKSGDETVAEVAPVTEGGYPANSGKASRNDETVAEVRAVTAPRNSSEGTKTSPGVRKITAPVEKTGEVDALGGVGGDLDGEVSDGISTPNPDGVGGPAGNLNGVGGDDIATDVPSGPEGAALGGGIGGGLGTGSGTGNPVGDPLAGPGADAGAGLGTEDPLADAGDLGTTPIEGADGTSNPIMGGDMSDLTGGKDGIEPEGSLTGDDLGGLGHDPTKDTDDVEDEDEVDGEGGEGGLPEDRFGKSSANGKHIMSFREMLDSKRVAKSGRPDAVSSVGGDIERPQLGKVAKSTAKTVRIGRGVNPRDVTQNDWDEYNNYKSRFGF